jgi:hypothetical protein
MLVCPEKTKNLLMRWPQPAGHHIKQLLSGMASIAVGSWLDGLNANYKKAAVDIVNYLDMGISSQHHFMIAEWCIRVLEHVAWIV